jgi:phosphoribosyl 1,2-cyclic phosphate phosphodiesterase
LFQPPTDNVFLKDTHLSKRPVTSDISGELIFLGTGTSHGVPMIGCGCATCSSNNPKDSRTRCSLLLGLPEGNLLVDSPPDLRDQLIREKMGMVDAVLYTHEHVDHMFGLDDLRIFPHYLGHDLPVYCSALVESRIRTVFDYAFDPITRAYPAGGVPRLELNCIDLEPFDVLGIKVVPLPLIHGRFNTLGYRFGNIAYCTDTNDIPPSSMEQLGGLDVLIIDGLRRKPHPTHFSIDEAIEVSRKLKPKRTLFTHICHNLGHAETNAWLPSGMELAFDGMRLPLS